MLRNPLSAAQRSDRIGRAGRVVRGSLIGIPAFFSLFSAFLFQYLSFGPYSMVCSPRFLLRDEGFHNGGAAD